MNVLKALLPPPSDSLQTRNSVFVQFFSSYLLLFIVPVVLVTFATHQYILQLLEQEAENYNVRMMNHFSGTMDGHLQTMQEDSIQLLDSPQVLALLRLHREGEFVDNPDRVPIIKDLSQQFNNVFNNRTFIDGAYLYIPRYGKVMDASGYYDSDYYFSYVHAFLDAGDIDFEHRFSGRSMLAFTEMQTIGKIDPFLKTLQSSARYISAVTSYPFRSNQPEAYLVVNIREETFKELIRTGDEVVLGSLILDQQGRILSQAGPKPLPQESLLEAIGGRSAGSVNAEIGGKPVLINFTSSDFNHWKYISVVDLNELREPASVVSRIMLALLALFLVAGAVIAYAIGQRMYRPIKEIKLGLESAQGMGEPPAGRGSNEYDFIKKWSGVLIDKNKAMNQQLEGMKPVTHEDFLSKVLSGELGDELCISMYAQEIELDFPTAGAKTVLVLECGFAKAWSETAKRYRIIEIKNTISREWCRPSWFCQMDPDRLAVIAETGASEAHSGKTMAEALLALFERHYADMHAAIAVGPEIDSVPQLHESYRQACEMLKYKSFSPKNEVLDAVRMKYEQARSQADHYLSDSEIRFLSNMIQMGDLEACNKRLEHMLARLLSGHVKRQQAIAWGVDLMNAVIRVAAASQSRDFSMERYLSWYDELQQCSGADELRSFFQRIFSEAVEQKDRDGDKQMLFEEVLRVIHERYHEDLTLEQFAAKCNMSTGHFSRNFKEVVGEKYIEYLTKYRLNAAKTLLLETDKKIEDISEAVGYMGRNSFINIFKKYEGVTPGKYRQLHKLGGDAGEGGQHAYRGFSGRLRAAEVERASVEEA